MISLNSIYFYIIQSLCLIEHQILISKFSILPLSFNILGSMSWSFLSNVAFTWFDLVAELELEQAFIKLKNYYGYIFKILIYKD